MRLLTAAIRNLYERLRDRPFSPGKNIAGRYTVETVLGIGSYGIGYLCRDRRTNRRCVLKQVKPSKRKGRKGKPVHEREASILQMLDHPGIPKLLDRFSFEGHLFLCMEYKGGRNLEDCLFADGRTFSEREALQLARRLADIVEYVHGRGIIHRDIRIPNVVLQDDGGLALIDFGLACFEGDAAEAAKADETAERYATEKWMRRKPEVARDFYAMGHFMLFLLYSGYEAKPGTLERSWEEELALSPPVRGLLRRLLQIDEPYADASELKAELDRCLARQP